MCVHLGIKASDVRNFPTISTVMIKLVLYFQHDSRAFTPFKHNKLHGKQLKLDQIISVE